MLSPAAGLKTPGCSLDGAGLVPVAHATEVCAPVDLANADLVQLRPPCPRQHRITDTRLLLNGRHALSGAALQ